MSRIFALILLLVLCSACTSGIRSATFTEQSTGATIQIDLEPTHPYLAEYSRTLIFKKSGFPDSRHQLSKDTGGYAAANLYKCADNLMMLDSYSEFVLVDTSTGKISPGNCPASSTYVGMFDGGGSKPWAFFPASQRSEKALVMRGG
ncbi:hypothetical protein [Stenotrophomonas pigmentata]|uniref:hypothetical protein n=1 Tax=Stenotrophomonas pigmentata TaxID=3055080 RepID=UPI0026ED4BC8|nr:hypothetical protein [Stenotrophomonas sp. 610A2]